MLRGDTSGRVPFALVAVLLLLSAGLGAAYVAKLGHDEAAHRIREERLVALAHVADAVHAEVVAQAQHLAVDAVARGTDGFVNESRVRAAFRGSLADYVARHFPRTVRTVDVRVTDFGGDLRLVDRRTVDLAAPERTHREAVSGAVVETPDRGAPETWREVDRLAYFAIHGFVNYTAALDDVRLDRVAPLRTLVPVPAPLMEGKLEQAVRSGYGDATGVGRTVKAIVASLAQFRVLNGVASAARPGTTTRDVITAEDVALAVNLAVLLEEIRLFRTFDRDAARAVDAATGWPEVPDDLEPPTEARTLVRLLDRYGATGAVDPAELFALYARLDAHGIAVDALLSQSVAALADEAVLKHLDYLGLTPLADWLLEVAEGAAADLDAFLRWLSGRPSQDVEYLHQFVGSLFLETEMSTAFLGPVAFPVPERSYEVADGSNPVSTTIPAHTALAPFPAKDLLARGYDGFWTAYAPEFRDDVRRVHGGVRHLVQDVAGAVGRDAVRAGLLPGSVRIPVDPTDDRTLLATAEAAVGDAVDRAVDWVRSDPNAVDVMMANLWNATRGTVQALVAHLTSSYGVLVDEAAEVERAERAVADALFARASADPDYATLTEGQREALRAAIADDVRLSGWVASALSLRRDRDRETWRHVLAAANETALPGSPSLRDDLREAAIGAGGWLLLARGAVHGTMAAAVEAARVAGLHTVLATRLDAFTLWDAAEPDRRATEAFRVRHSPGFLQPNTSAMRIDIEDPSQLPVTPDTPNVHYTKPFEPSARPFATQWTVHVSGLVRLRVETAERVLLGPEGLVPAVVAAEWPLRFSFSVPAYSGWNLTGVRYGDSNTLAGDVWDAALAFLDRAWEDLVRVAKWSLDFVGYVVALVKTLVEPLLALADKVVAVLTREFAAAVDLLFDLATGAIDITFALIDLVLDRFPSNTQFTLQGFGLEWGFTLNGAAGREVELYLPTHVGELRLVFLDLAEAGLADARTRYDVFARWTVAEGPFRLDTVLDPLMAVQEKVVQGMASWDGSWAIEFAGPEPEAFASHTAAIGFGPIPVPPGLTADVEIGVEVHALGTLPDLVGDLLWRSLEETSRAFAQDPASWDGLGIFASVFAERIAANVAEVLERQAADLLEVALYVQVQVNAAGGPAGGGMRLALAADGVAVHRLFLWIARNVPAFLHNLLNPLAPADYEALPAEIMEHLYVHATGFLSLGMPRYLGRFLEAAVPGLDGELRVAAVIRANAPTFGLLLGADWGRWEVTFGANFETPAGVLTAFGAADGGGRLWLLRGSLHAD